MIYLASPYSGTFLEESFRFEKTQEYVARCMKQGLLVFSPIVYAHHMARDFEIGTDAEAWEEFNTEMITMCLDFWVLKLEGWEKSVGVQGEIFLARKLEREIKFIEVFIREDY